MKVTDRKFLSPNSRYNLRIHIKVAGESIEHPLSGQTIRPPGDQFQFSGGDIAYYLINVYLSFYLQQSDFLLVFIHSLVQWSSIKH